MSIKSWLFISIILVTNYQNSYAQLKQNCTLLSITDGDTLLARCQTSTERIRLIGIDAPELSQGEHSAWQAKQYGVRETEIRQMGKSAKKHLSELLSIGETIELRQDQESRDRFGRLLAYVYKADGDFINSKMIYDGYASTMSIKPNTTFADKFSQLYRDAQLNKRGLWGDRDG